MRAIKRRNHALAALSCLGILAAALLLAFGSGVSEIRARMVPACALVAAAAAAGFWLRGLGRLRIARLIAENPILHIHTAVISELSGKAAKGSDAGSTEIIVSYFGILLGEKIIKFNQDGIRLRAVEIGGDFISFTCGTEERTQNIRLLRPAIETAELDEIAEKFRYETGITPEFTYKNSYPFDMAGAEK